ncbi:PREDICTED: fatty acyl-CoA reductase 1-like [Priapulus caudatus]|uniref:Fatty acyl-CoA reductase n=1 Tax=Priapulus caudatus TaxID=37621 RepID=A0ABM1ED83_PRICU|nr:PREDICTED: fatty acyl-CoA reductase 1-like [Priapulus caudatus]
MDDDMCDAVTSHLLGSRPNTYTYTKALAEHLVAEGRGDIPTAIIRPSIIGAAWREPMPGWIDNYNGPTGIFVGIGKGLLRYMMGSMAATADIIPVDIPVNMMIAIAWQTAVTRPERVHVFNCTSGRTNPVSWGEIETMIVKSVTKNPIDKVFRVPSARFTASPLWYRLVVIFDHYLPAYIFDLVTKFIGGKPILMRIYDKIHRSLATLDYFTSNNWDFASENSLMLTSAMTEEDLKEFNFSMNGLRWQSYLDTYVLGTKQFVLKEDLAGLPLARRHLLKLQIFQYLMQVVLFCVVWRLLVARTNIARKLWRFVISLSQKFVVRLPRVTRSS